jgi:hypothetical protein
MNKGRKWLKRPQKRDDLRIRVGPSHLFWDDRRPVWGLPVYPDFLRQVFNVVLAEHNVDERTTTEAKKIVWEAENKFKFSSFDNPDPRPRLKEFFESEEFIQLLKLLKRKNGVLETLLERIKEYYGDELYEIAKKKYEEVKKED